MVMVVVIKMMFAVRVMINSVDDDDGGVGVDNDDVVDEVDVRGCDEADVVSHGSGVNGGCDKDVCVDGDNK